MKRMSKEKGVELLEDAFSQYINNLYAMSSMTISNSRTAKYNDRVRNVRLISRRIREINEENEKGEKILAELEKCEKARIGNIKMKLLLSRKYKSVEDIPESEIESEIAEADNFHTVAGLPIHPSRLPSHELAYNLFFSDSYEQLNFRNAFISIISTYEIFFASLLEISYRMNPDRLKSGDSDSEKGSKNFENILNMLFEYENIDGIVDSLINKKIDAVMRQSFEERLRSAFKGTGFNLEDTYFDIDLYISYFQLRNIIVHNNSVVNSIYSSKVREEYRENFKEGQTFIINKEYFEKFVQYFALAGAVSLNEVWKLIYKNDNKKRITEMNNFIYFAALKRHWIVVDNLSSRIIKQDGKDGEIKMMIYMHYCLAQKNTGYFSRVKQEIEDFDHGMYSNRLSLAAYALLGDFENVKKLLRTVSLSSGELAEWPLLVDFRREASFSDCLREAIEKEKPLNNILIKGFNEDEQKHFDLDLQNN